VKKNVKLSIKMYFGFAVPVVILVAIGAFAYFQSASVQEVARLTKEESAVYAERARDMQLHVVQVQQWLTDASLTGAAEGTEGYKEAEAHAQAFHQNLQQFREMFQSENDSEGLAQVKSLEEKFAAYYDSGKSMAKTYAEQGREEGNKAMERFDTAAEALTAAVDPFVKSQADELNASMENVSARSGQLKAAVSVGAIAAVILSIFTAWGITRSVTKPINHVITSLTDGADQLNDAAGQVSSASQQLAEGASEQASSLEETSSALQEMAAMTRTNAENAKQADGLANQTRTAAEEGDHTTTRLGDAMTAINTASDKISKIIKVIEEIAFQTNLLALNAAVEAARAGEHGKGFAVVAEEVRNLAQRAAQAARETTSLIEDSVKRAREGNEVAGQVAKVLGVIVENVTKVTTLVNGIAQASQEQAQGVEQITTAVSQMDKVTQQNAAGAEESASAAEELAAQAQAVRGMVGDLVTLVHGCRSHDTGGYEASGGGHTAPHAKPKNQLRKTEFARLSGAKTKHGPTLGGTKPATESSAPDAVSTKLQDF